MLRRFSAKEKRRKESVLLITTTIVQPGYTSITLFIKVGIVIQ